MSKSENVAAGGRVLFFQIDERWEEIYNRLPERFTTQDFRSLVEVHAPGAWRAIVLKYGSGGKGSGSFYSPANILFNYLKERSRDQLIEQVEFVESLPGWGSRRVMQFRKSDLPPIEQDDLFAEGSVSYRVHLIRERSRGLRKAVLDKRRSAGLVCDACGTGGHPSAKALREAIFEVHHDSSPISAGAATRRISDMALLCANCHRMIHKLIATKKSWLTVNEAKQILIAFA